MSIVELPHVTISNIPNVLRSIADAIENGDHGKPSTLVVVLNDVDGNVYVFGGGAGSQKMNALGLLAAGSHHLLNAC